MYSIILYHLPCYRPSRPIVFFESMLAKTDDTLIVNPLAETIKQTLEIAKQWTTKAKQMQVNTIITLIIVILV